MKWVLGLVKRRRRERERGDSLNTEGIGQRMINYWYLVVTGDWCVGFWPFFFVFNTSSKIFKCFIKIIRIFNFIYTLCLTKYKQILVK